MTFRVSAISMIFAATGLLLLGLARPADATQWQALQSTARSQTEIDLDSITKKEPGSTAWLQQVHAAPTASKSGPYVVYRTLKMQMRFQCPVRSATVLTRSYIDDQGTEVGSERPPEAAQVVSPESPEGLALEIACAADPRKAAAALKRSALAGRYMDGPATPATRRPEFIKANASADHDAPGAEAAPAAKAAAAPGAHGAPAPTAPGQGAVPAAAFPHSAAPAAHGAAHAVPVKAESRDKVVARVLKERAAKGSAPAAAGHEEAHWAYEGENAAFRWGDMKSEYATCKSGLRQSPIDIRDPVVAEMSPVVFHYEESPLKVLNNGHTIQVELAPGSFILHSGARFELLQLHFHTPAEERINGRSFDMVAHLVHKSAQGKLAVVAVLLNAGQANTAIEAIWNTMPGVAGRTRERPEVQFNPMSLLPADRSYYAFEGSLTTPPCTEGVQWLVLKTPVEMAREQVLHFAALYPMNARPLQPANDRVVKAGR
jgi:carbonic anhydrase